MRFSSQHNMITYSIWCFTDFFICSLKSCNKEFFFFLALKSLSHPRSKCVCISFSLNSEQSVLRYLNLCHHNCFKNMQLTIAFSFWDLNLNIILCLLCILYLGTTTLGTVLCILWFGILVHSWFIENRICILLFVFCVVLGWFPAEDNMPILYGQLCWKSPQKYFIVL